MKLNVPHRLRIAIYIFTAIGTPIVAYLASRGIIGDLEVGLWGAEVTVAATLAALNVVTSDDSSSQ